MTNGPIKLYKLPYKSSVNQITSQMQSPNLDLSVAEMNSCKYFLLN